MGLVDWHLVLLAFGLLIVAELGDKTQLVVFSLVSQYRAPLPIFIGASLALTVLTLVAVIAGQFISSVVPVRYIQIGAGLMFIGIGAGILWRVLCETLGR
ncbi:MAG: TMEM165/GDT1 family protein [Firmicutes bacterium]|jgi:putative Ca2+/H+ antiporter (TMEM165/GDT1 family)|nr:TMEM165/GDT1 family protein [Bacillota bacterium]